MKLLNLVFYIIALTLHSLAKIFKTTYEFVNILIYYLIIPLSWTIILDLKIGMPITTIALLLIWLGIYIATKSIFKEWCNWVFKDSVDFLNWFNRWGSNYISSSVIICVIIPIIIYIILLLI